MIIVAYPGVWEEAIGICFTYSGSTPIRGVYLVYPSEANEQIENDAILLCPTVPFSVPKEVTIQLGQSCSNCENLLHRSVRRDDLRRVLKERLADLRIKVSYVESASIRLFDTTAVVTLDNREIESENVLIVSKAATWNWKWISNVPLSLLVECDGRHISHWEAWSDDDINKRVPPLGKISGKNGELVQWMLTPENRYLIRVNELGDSNKATLQRLLTLGKWPIVHLNPCTRVRKWSIRRWILSRFTRVALVSFLKKWVLMYLQTWLKVATAIYLGARSRFFAPYVAFYSVELFIAWFMVKAKGRGYFSTILSLLTSALMLLEKAEARVRLATRSKFFSFTLIFTLVQILVVECWKVLWSIALHYYTGPKAVKVPVVRGRINGNDESGSKVKTLLLDTDDSFENMAYSKLVTTHWKPSKEVK